MPDDELDDRISELEDELRELRSLPVPKNGEGRIAGAFRQQFEEIERLYNAFRPEWRIDVPAPVVNVEPAILSLDGVVINVPEQPPAEVRVAVPDQTAAIDALTQAIRDWIAADAAEDTLGDSMPKTVTVKRDKNGLISSMTIQG